MSQKQFRSSIIGAIILQNDINLTERSKSYPNKRLKRNNIGISGIEEDYPGRSENAEHLPIFVKKDQTVDFVLQEMKEMTREQKEKKHMSDVSTQIVRFTFVVMQLEIALQNGMDRITQNFN